MQKQSGYYFLIGKNGLTLLSLKTCRHADICFLHGKYESLRSEMSFHLQRLKNANSSDMFVSIP